VPVLLIRHAHAGSRKAWQDPDELRPLSVKGRRQGSALVELVKPWAPARILSSPTVRCVQTVEPLATALGLEIETVDELAEGADRKAVDLVRSLAGRRVALCTHGDVIPNVLVALVDEDHLDLGPAPRQAKGSVWVLEAKNGRFVKARYIPAR